MKGSLQLPQGIFLEFKTEYEFPSLSDHLTAANLSRDVRMAGGMSANIARNRAEFPLSPFWRPSACVSLRHLSFIITNGQMTAQFSLCLESQALLFSWPILNSNFIDLPHL